MSAPVFSVVIPTFNRPHQVTACLAALASVDYEKDGLEVILVDDGGSCNLQAIVERFEGRLQIRLERQPNSGPASARNRGADCASGEFLAFTDDDCEPHRDWLRTMEARLRLQPNYAIGGGIVNAATDDVFATAGQSILDCLYLYYNGDGERPRFFASSNIAVRAAEFREIEGFHTGFPLAAGEDREFCDRWLRRGLGLTYAPEALVRHNHRMGVQEYWKQHFRYGRGALQYRRLSRQPSRTFTFEPFALYSEILRRPFRESSGWKMVQTSAAVALAQFAVASGFCCQAVLG